MTPRWSLVQPPMVTALSLSWPQRRLPHSPDLTSCWTLDLGFVTAVVAACIWTPGVTSTWEQSCHIPTHVAGTLRPSHSGLHVVTEPSRASTLALSCPPGRLGRA